MEKVRADYTLLPVESRPELCDVKIGRFQDHRFRPVGGLGLTEDSPLLQDASGLQWGTSPTPTPEQLVQGEGARELSSDILGLPTPTPQGFPRVTAGGQRPPQKKMDLKDPRT